MRVMRHSTLRFAVALSTFLIGVSVASVWLVKHRVPAHAPGQVSDCVPVYDPPSDTRLSEDDDPKVFAAFGELPLEALPACVDESYRLTWLPTFHSPVVVRLWRSGDKYFVVSKQLSGKGGYEIGELDIEETRLLTQNEWLEFMTLLNRASFWEFPSTVSEPMMNDGAVWLVEGVKAGKYHWVRRMTPSGQDAEIYRHLIKLSGLQTRHDMYLQ